MQDVDNAKLTRLPTRQPTPEGECTLCGKKMDMWDRQEDFKLNYHVGYGSKYDTTIVDVRLCCDCFDKIIDHIAIHGKYDPVVAEYRLINT